MRLGADSVIGADCNEVDGLFGAVPRNLKCLRELLYVCTGSPSRKQLARLGLRSREVVGASLCRRGCASDFRCGWYACQAEVLSKDLADALDVEAEPPGDLCEGQALHDAQAEHLKLSLAMPPSVAREREAMAMQHAHDLVKLRALSKRRALDQVAARVFEKPVNVMDVGRFQGSESGGA